MFVGEYQHSLDDKGRVTIPSRLRDELGEHFMITRGLDQCLFIYPVNQWPRFEEKITGLPLTKRDARAVQRLFFSGAEKVKVDKQGRVLIPQNLRDHAGIEKEVMIIGVSDRVEVWSEQAWKTYSNEASASFEQIAEKLVNFDL